MDVMRCVFHLASTLPDRFGRMMMDGHQLYSLPGDAFLCSVPVEQIPDPELALPRAGVWEEETIGMQTLGLHLVSQD